MKFLENNNSLDHLVLSINAFQMINKENISPKVNDFLDVVRECISEAQSRTQPSIIFPTEPSPETLIDLNRTMGKAKNDIHMPAYHEESSDDFIKNGRIKFFDMRTNRRRHFE